MKTQPLMIAALLLAAGTPALAENELGKREFNNSCAVCHGQDGRANMQINDILKQQPPNLRLLAKRNGGVFPVARVYDVIDGRSTVTAHGTRDMPIWGARYVDEIVSQRLYYDDYPCSPENFARMRILSLIDHLSKMQDR